jgi:F-type H+-transporting ATPase subunit delta
MAELATIARPYAEALFQSVCYPTFRPQPIGLMNWDVIAQNAQLLQFADSPKVER